MMDKREFYIDGAWVAPRAGSDFAVIDPSNEEAFATISLGGQADTDAAVAAAKAAFPKWRLSSKAERLELMQEILDVYMKRSDDMGAVISQEMGAPIDMAKVQQSGTGSFHIKAFIEAMNQISLKVLPALATGCTMILKPSEQSPLSAMLFSEIMHEAGVPAGVYNMVNGDGPGVGSQLSAHKDVDMVSFRCKSDLCRCG